MCGISVVGYVSIEYAAGINSFIVVVLLNRRGWDGNIKISCVE